MMIRYLEDLIVIEKNTEVFVIAPQLDIVLTKVTLPKLSREKQKQALPFALEENLIEDVSQLHFATADREPNGTIPVAVVAKEKMQHWLNLLISAGISPNAMIPAALALPFSENHWHVYSLENITLVRTGKFSGCALDNANLNDFIQSRPVTQINLSQKTFEEQLLLGLSNTPHINLLQGTYLLKRKNLHNKHVWKIAAYAATAWVSLVFLSHAISFLILHHTESKLNTKIAEIYHHQFPNANNLTAPRERMEQKLKQMTEAASKNNFLSLLAIIAKATTKTQGIHLQNLVYADNALTLDVSASTFDALDSLTRELNDQGLNVKQQNAGMAGTQVKATLLITAGAS